MIFGLKLTFDIKGKQQEAYKVKWTDNEIKVNGAKKWKRIPLKKEHFKMIEYKGLKPERAKDFDGLYSMNPLATGKYSVKYNEKKYYMTYLDELELFKQVVL